MMGRSPGLGLTPPSSSSVRAGVVRSALMAASSPSWAVWAALISAFSARAAARSAASLAAVASAMVEVASGSRPTCSISGMERCLRWCARGVVTAAPVRYRDRAAGPALSRPAAKVRLVALADAGGASMTLQMRQAALDVAGLVEAGQGVAQVGQVELAPGVMVRVMA